MKFDSDDFELFGLQRRFEQDRAELDARWRALQGKVHPDRFASDGAAAQRAAMQWAVRVNEAHQRLRDPLKRAAYLCELSGAPIDAESNTAMPGEFLVQQMAWREALDDAEDLSTVNQLAEQVASFRRDALARLHETLDQHGDAIEAARQVRALMFVERFADDVDRRLELLEQQEH
ncbi:MAG: Fe-S protein assembly co-chaperone HscB [Ideonella sp.]